MPERNKMKLIWSNAAGRDLIRLRGFIELYNKEAARRAADAIKKAAFMLVDYPTIGKPIEGGHGQERELSIPFGQRGYAMRYRIHDDIVIILRIWQGLEDR